MPSSNMVPMYSTVSLKKITNPGDLDPAYWSRGLTSPVQFSQAIENVMSDFSESQLILLEIGAHSTFAGFIKQIVESTGVDEVRFPVYVPTLTRNDPDASAQLLAVAGRLHSIGVEIDMPSVTGVQSVECNLPSYPWDRRLYRSESRLARDWRLRAAPHHELLGSRVPAMPDQEPAWRNIIRMGDVLWLGEHVLGGKVIFPAAGYIAMAGAACTQLRGESVSYTVRNLVLTSFLTLLPGQQLELLTTFKKQKYNDLMESDWYNFSISSHDGTGWTKHCNGTVRAECFGSTTTEELGAQAIFPSYSRRVNSDKWYKAIRKFGYEYGQRFRGLENVSADPVQISAAGTVEDTSSDQYEDPMYFIHPTVIDSCLQMMGVARAHGLSRRIDVMEIPGSVESVFIARNGLKTSVNVQGIDEANQNLSWNAVAVSGGRVVLSVRNVRSVVMNRRLNKSLPIPPLTNLRWIPLLGLLTNHESLLSAKSPFSSTESQQPWSTFLTLLAHSQPSLHILEIGSGAPAITRSNLEHLKTREGTRLFSSYTLTCMSAVSLDQLKLEFDDIPGVNFKVYNVRDDLESQGLDAHSFDLVLITAVTRLLSPESLTYVRELLAPGGWVLVQNAILSDGAPSNTSNGDALAGDASSLRNGFEAAGLKCVEDFVDKDAENEPGVSKLTLLARATVKEQEPSKTVTLLTRDDYSCVQTDTIAHELAKRGCTTNRTTVSTPPHPGQFIISVLDFGSAALHSLSEDSFTLLKRYLLNSEAKHVLWITKTTQTYCHDPRYGLVHGFVRTLRQECGLNLSTLEVDELDARSAKLVSTLQIWIEQNMDSVGRKLDAEFAILNGQLQVARYHWVSELPRLRSRSLTAESVLRLHLDTSLSSQSCSWVRSTNSVLAENQVEVDIQYVGLNFRVSSKRSH